jgi:hypothetical protein
MAVNELRIDKTMMFVRRFKVVNVFGLIRMHREGGKKQIGFDMKGRNDTVVFMRPPNNEDRRIGFHACKMVQQSLKAVYIADLISVSFHFSSYLVR